MGVIIGAAFGKIVSSLVNDILMPPLGMLIGGIDFGDMALTLKAPVGNAKPVVVHYGLFINNLIDFLIVAAVRFSGRQRDKHFKEVAESDRSNRKKLPAMRHGDSHRRQKVRPLHINPLERL